MLVLSLPPVPRFASAGLPGSSAAPPHLRSHSHCLKNIPLSRCDPAVDWGARCRVTAVTVGAWTDITWQHISHLTSVCLQSLPAVSQFLPSQWQSVCAAPAPERSAPPALLGSHFPDYTEMDGSGWNDFSSDWCSEWRIFKNIFRLSSGTVLVLGRS